MPDVSFHTNVPDRMGYACRLLRKAVRNPCGLSGTR